MKKIDLQQDQEGELYDQIALQESQLRWSSIESDVILNGGS